jgi:hypothetical protein
MIMGTFIWWSAAAAGWTMPALADPHTATARCIEMSIV